jgi:ADP-ribose pyrophosphatase YjhB (NUDIX family)
MEPKNFYKFCPKCGGNLVFQKENCLICRNCKFHFYINPLPCNAAIIENEKGEIMLVERKVDPKKGFWDWPGGFINPGESLEDSLKREIKEELNVDIKILGIVGVYIDRYLYQNILNYALCVAVSAKITGGQLKPHDDIDGYKFFPKNEILNQKFAFLSIKQGISDYLAGR